VQPIEDHAGQEYWNQNWQRQPLPALWDVDGNSLRSYAERRFFRCISDVLTARNLTHAGKSLVEVGCARSAVLPLFSSKLGFSIAGIDYSPVGCEQTRAILDRENIDGDVIETDVFSPSADLLGRFDVVLSIGLVEHFSDTTAILRALSDLLRPGGIIITIVPNMNGATGLIQKMLDRGVFDIHLPLTREQLSDAHISAGLHVEGCDYFLPSSFGVCNLNTTSRTTAKWWLKKVGLASLSRLSMLSWWVEERFGNLPVSRSFSPYLNCVASKLT
jgi:2-polyprenyl-3-methyl-5-hydroxy-6-metoxy-1,4-benzoquinol methylase